MFSNSPFMKTLIAEVSERLGFDQPLSERELLKFGMIFPSAKVKIFKSRYLFTSQITLKECILHALSKSLGIYRSRPSVPLSREDIYR